MLDQATSEPIYDPEAAELYVVEFCGSCLGDWLPNGTTMWVSRTAEIRPFDIVSLVLKPDATHWTELMNSVGGGFAGVCKYFLGSYEANAGRAVVVGQLKPPCVAIVPVNMIEAMHRVIGAPGSEPEMGELDKAAAELIRPFQPGGASDPINPTWEPSSWA